MDVSGRTTRDVLAMLETLLAVVQEPVFTDIQHIQVYICTHTYTQASFSQQLFRVMGAYGRGVLALNGCIIVHNYSVRRGRPEC